MLIDLMLPLSHTAQRQLNELLQFLPSTNVQLSHNKADNRQLISTGRQPTTKIFYDPVVESVHHLTLHLQTLQRIWQKLNMQDEIATFSHVTEFVHKIQPTFIVRHMSDLFRGLLMNNVLCVQ